MQHKDIPLGDIHYVHNWEVANAAARAALTPVAADKGKLVWQTDTNEFFFLANHVGPVWVGALGVSGPPGPRGFSVLNGVVAPVAEDGVNGDFFLNTATSILYGPKAAGAWPAGTSLVGTNGVGVPAGGTAGKVLAKVTATDFDTAWATLLPVPAGGTAGQRLTKVDGTDGNASWVTPALSREILAANRTYYVATTGSDSNDGLTAGTAFLTIQKAVDVICSTLDISSYTVTVSCGAGARTATTVLKQLQTTGGSVNIVGDETTPANCTITTTSASCFSTSESAGPYRVSGFKLSTVTSGHGLLAGGKGSILRFKNMDFGACASTHMQATAGSLIEATGPYTISGAAPMHCSGLTGGAITIQVQTVTITGTPNFSFAYAVGQTLAILTLYNNTYTGSATGARYNATVNSVINTASGNVDILPGNAAGTTATGGQYA